MIPCWKLIFNWSHAPPEIIATFLSGFLFLIIMRINTWILPTFAHYLPPVFWYKASRRTTLKLFDTNSKRLWCFVCLVTLLSLFKCHVPAFFDKGNFIFCLLLLLQSGSCTRGRGGNVSISSSSVLLSLLHCYPSSSIFMSFFIIFICHFVAVVSNYVALTALV